MTPTQSPLDAKGLADRLASLHMNSCTCPRVTSQHPPECPTAIIDDCCAFLRAYIASQEAAAPSEEPVAWMFELTLSHDSVSGYGDWAPARVSLTQPAVPLGSIRNLRPLFASPAPVALVEVSVKGLDESETQGWRDDKGHFCLPMSDGYFIKFPSEKLPPDRRLFMAWFSSDPIGGHAEMAGARKIAQDHHRARILSSIIPATKPAAEMLPDALSLLHRLVPAVKAGGSIAERKELSAFLKMHPAALSAGTATPAREKQLFKCAYCRATFDDPTTLCGLEKCDFSPVAGTATPKPEVEK